PLIALLFVLAPLKLFTPSASNSSTPCRLDKKSTCYHARRTSPYVIDFRSTSICFTTIFYISSSPPPVSCCWSFFLFSISILACLILSVVSNLPTSSACDGKVIVILITPFQFLL